MIKLRIRDINPHIVCSLCAGYFIEATTITECLHTFCKSCVVKFLQTSKCCPQCGLKVHETQPLLNLKPDRVLQDIVFKLVPGLYENEEKRKEEFDGEDMGKDSSYLDNENNIDTNDSIEPRAHYYANDNMICFSLNLHRDLKDLKASFDIEQRINKTLKNKFIRCSERGCLIHIKNLIAKVLELNPDKLGQIHITTDNKNNKNNNHNINNHNNIGGSSNGDKRYSDKDGNVDDDGSDRNSDDDDLDDWVTLRQLWLMRWPASSAPLPLYFKINQSGS